MARILHIAPFPFPAPFGSQVYAAGLAAAQARAGHEVWLGCYAGSQGKSPAGVRLIRARAGGLKRGLHAGKLLANASLVHRCRALLQAQRIDVVLGHNVEGPVLASLCGAPNIAYLQHTRMEEELPDWLGAPLVTTRLGRMVDAAASRSASTVVSLSSGGDGVVVPPGIELSELAGADGPHFARRHSLADHPWVVYTGNTDAYQDLPDLLAAAALVDLPLLLVTGDDTTPWIRAARAAKLTRFRAIHTDAFSDHRDALDLATVAVIPRRQAAGFPMKLLNQLGLGTATVGTLGALPAMPGVVRVQPGAIADLADALAHLVAHPAEAAALGYAGQHAVTTRWSWDARAKQLDQVLAICPRP